jgi:hypothetical protein
MDQQQAAVINNMLQVLAPQKVATPPVSADAANAQLDLTNLLDKDYLAKYSYDPGIVTLSGEDTGRYGGYKRTSDKISLEVGKGDTVDDVVDTVLHEFRHRSIQRLVNAHKTMLSDGTEELVVRRADEKLLGDRKGGQEATRYLDKHLADKNGGRINADEILSKYINFQQVPE